MGRLGQSAKQAAGSENDILLYLDQIVARVEETRDICVSKVLSSHIKKAPPLTVLYVCLAITGVCTWQLIKTYEFTRDYSYPI